jgi:hypothetical protein
MECLNESSFTRRKDIFFWNSLGNNGDVVSYAENLGLTGEFLVNLVSVDFNKSNWAGLFLVF